MTKTALIVFSLCSLSVQATVYECDRGLANTDLVLTITKENATIKTRWSNSMTRPRMHAALNNDWSYVHRGFARYGTFNSTSSPFDIQVSPELMRGQPYGTFSMSTKSGYDIANFCNIKK